MKFHKLISFTIFVFLSIIIINSFINFRRQEPAVHSLTIIKSLSPFCFSLQLNWIFILRENLRAHNLNLYVRLFVNKPRAEWIFLHSRMDLIVCENSIYKAILCEISHFKLKSNFYSEKKSVKADNISTK